MIAPNPNRPHCPYAVGDVLTTSNSADPSTRWPGTSWTQIKDCFLLAAGDSHAAGSTGGSVSHIHGIEKATAYIRLDDAGEIESIDGAAVWYNGDTISWTGTRFVTANSHRYSDGGFNRGSDDRAARVAGITQTADNMPPYRAFYMWQRTK